MTALLDNFSVFSKEAYTATFEMLAQYLEDFNSATGNAFVMSTSRTAGDNETIAEFKRIVNTAVRRDAYDDTTNIDTTKLEMLNKVGVKIGGRTDEILFSSNQFNWLQQNPALAESIISKQLAEAMFQDMVNTAITCAKTAMVAQGSVGYTIPASGTMTRAGLLNGSKIFGDRAQDIKVWVMHSTPKFAVDAENIANSANLFTLGDVKVQEDGFGRRFVVTDSPSLYSGSPSDFYTLGLTEGAIVVSDEGTFQDNMVKENGKENIQSSYQAQWDFLMKIKGYSFSTSVKSPTDAELATGGNWTEYFASLKHSAGVYVKSR